MKKNNYSFLYRIFLVAYAGTTVVYFFFPLILVLQQCHVINLYSACGLIQASSPVNIFCCLASYFHIVFDFFFLSTGLGLHCDEISYFA